MIVLEISLYLCELSGRLDFDWFQVFSSTESLIVAIFFKYKPIKP